MLAARDRGRHKAGRGVLSEILMSVRDLTKHYPVGGGFGRQARIVRAVDGVTLDIYERETFALVGESGAAAGLRSGRYPGQRGSGCGSDSPWAG